MTGNIEQGAVPMHPADAQKIVQRHGPILTPTNAPLAQYVRGLDEPPEGWAAYWQARRKARELMEQYWPFD